MHSANTFISAWRKYCTKLVKENGHYYLVKNDVNNYERIWKEMKEKGFHCVGPSNAQSNPIICINIETMTFFSGTVGYEKIGIDFNNNKTITYEDFAKLLV